MTIDEMIARYGLVDCGDKVRIDNHYHYLKDNAAEIIKENKPAILARLREIKAEKARKWQEREDRINAIEGLSEIKAAYHDLELWHDEFEASFSDVGGMGVRPKPKYDFEAMKAKYPRAAAYLKAEELKWKTNDNLSAIGKKALEMIIYGDYQEALEYIKTEEEKFVNGHIWD